VKLNCTHVLPPAARKNQSFAEAGSIRSRAGRSAADVATQIAVSRSEGLGLRNPGKTVQELMPHAKSSAILKPLWP
jgi:hypothetical protein